MSQSPFPKRSSGRFEALRGRRKHRPARHSTKLLRYESLEDRTLLSVTVPTTFKDGVVPGKVTLRDAIIASNADPTQEAITIQLKAGTYTLGVANAETGHETASATGDLNIASEAHELILQGKTKAGAPATIIRQTALDRVFEIVNPGVKVVFKNLVIERGAAADDGSDVGLDTNALVGGGILNHGGNVTLDNVIVRSNKASVPKDGDGEAMGGGIFSQGGKLTLSKAVFSQNSAVGGQDSRGGGLYAADTDVSMTKVTFSKNLARGYQTGMGGGLFFANASENPALIVTSSAFSDNTAVGADGSSGGATTSETSSESPPGGTGQGGGIYLESGVATLAKVSFSMNVARGGNGANGRSSRGGGDGADGTDGGDGQGGGMFVYDASATLTQVTFSKNAAVGGNGGKGGNASKSQPSPSGSGSSPMGGNGGAGGNGGHGQGGGLYVGGGSVALSTVTLSENTAQGGSGGHGGKGVLVARSARAAATGTTGTTGTTGSTTSGGSSGAGGRGGIGGNAQGGGLYVGGGEVTLDLGTVKKNVVKRGAAGDRGFGTPPGEPGRAGLAQGAGIAVAPNGTFSATNTKFPRGQGPVNVDPGGDV